MGKKRKQERRSPGSGYASKAPNATWIAHFPKPTGGYRVKRGFDTRASAETWLDSLLTRQNDREDVDKGQQRFSVWMDAWKVRSERDREWKAKTIADVVWKLGYTKPFIGDMALADVMPDHIDAMLDELGKSLAQTTIRQIRNYLFQVFEAARERRYITHNPVIRPTRRKRPKQKEPIRLTAPQSSTLLRAAERSFYALAWWLILTLGLRAGEVCGLRWGDVDLDNAILHINQQVTDLRGVAHQDLPKNDKKRTLPIPRALIPLFHFHFRAYTRRAAQGVQKGYWQENALIFPGRGGRAMNPTSLRHQLTHLTVACKLPAVTTHMLRHTAGKFYTDLGTPDNIIGAILGHTPSITGHYAPPDAEAMRPWVEQVYRLLASEIEQTQEEGLTG